MKTGTTFTKTEDKAKAFAEDFLCLYRMWEAATNAFPAGDACPGRDIGTGQNKKRGNTPLSLLVSSRLRIVCRQFIRGRQHNRMATFYIP